MSAPGASPSEMPGFPFSGRVGPELDEHLLDTILTGQQLPPDAPEQAHVVAEMLASLISPAGSGELGGEEAARSAFARAASPVGVSPAARRPTRRKPSWLPLPLSARLAAVLVAAAAGLGGTVAAYAGVLPGPIQNLAHHAIGAPAARPASARAPGRPHGAYQMCTSYERAETHHDLRALAAESRKLARIAGDAGKIDAYCAAFARPGVVPSAGPVGRPGPRPANAAKAKARGTAGAHGQAKARGTAGAHGQAKARGQAKAGGTAGAPMARRRPVARRRQVARRAPAARRAPTSRPGTHRQGGTWSPNRITEAKST
jgi:hypothetical protein